MGAEQFMDYGYGQNAKEAFREAVEEAQYEYGHGGYTGTIAEKSACGFKEVPYDPGSLDITPEEYAELLMDKGKFDDKWGSAGCIEVESDKEGQRKFLFFGWASTKMTETVKVGDLYGGRCFRKVRGEYVYIRLDPSTVKFLGLDAKKVYGVSYNGNVTILDLTILDPTTEVVEMVHEDIVANKQEERAWENTFCWSVRRCPTCGRKPE